MAAGLPRFGMYLVVSKMKISDIIAIQFDVIAGVMSSSPAGFVTVPSLDFSFIDTFLPFEFHLSMMMSLVEEGVFRRGLFIDGGVSASLFGMQFAFTLKVELALPSATEVPNFVKNPLSVLDSAGITMTADVSLPFGLGSAHMTGALSKDLLKLEAYMTITVAGFELASMKFLLQYVRPGSDGRRLAEAVIETGDLQETGGREDADVTGTHVEEEDEETGESGLGDDQGTTSQGTNVQKHEPDARPAAHQASWSPQEAEGGKVVESETAMERKRRSLFAHIHHPHHPHSPHRHRPHTHAPHTHAPHSHHPHHPHRPHTHAPHIHAPHTHAPHTHAPHRHHPHHPHTPHDHRPPPAPHPPAPPYAAPPVPESSLAMEGNINLGPFGQIDLNGHITSSEMSLYGSIYRNVFGFKFCGSIASSYAEGQFSFGVDLLQDMGFFGTFFYSGLVTNEGLRLEGLRESNIAATLGNAIKDGIQAIIGDNGAAQVLGDWIATALDNTFNIRKVHVILDTISSQPTITAQLDLTVLGIDVKFGPFTLPLPGRRRLQSVEERKADFIRRNYTHLTLEDFEEWEGSTDVRGRRGTLASSCDGPTFTISDLVDKIKTAFTMENIIGIFNLCIDGYAQNRATGEVCGTNAQCLHGAVHATSSNNYFTGGRWCDLLDGQGGAASLGVLCAGTCKDMKPPGASCGTYANKQCQSGKCICSQCTRLDNDKLDDNKICSLDSDCSSGWCADREFAGCFGVCRAKLNEGAICANNGNCVSGQCTCGRCANTQGKHQAGRRCASNSACVSDWCENGVACVDHNTGGTCRDKKGPWESCNANGNCASGKCKCGKCSDYDGKMNNGYECDADSHCKSGKCKSKQCNALYVPKSCLVAKCCA